MVNKIMRNDQNAYRKYKASSISFYRHRGKKYASMLKAMPASAPLYAHQHQSAAGNSPYNAHGRRSNERDGLPRSRAAEQRYDARATARPSSATWAFKIDGSDSSEMRRLKKYIDRNSNIKHSNRLTVAARHYGTYAIYHVNLVSFTLYISSSMVAWEVQSNENINKISSKRNASRNEAE